MLIAYLKKCFLNSKEAHVLKKHYIQSTPWKEKQKNCITIKVFKSDNGVFKAAELRAEINNLVQTISYCGVSVHHQNEISERYIRTMVEKPE